MKFPFENKPIVTNRLVLRPLTPETQHRLFTEAADETLMRYFALDSTAVLQAEKEKFKSGFTTYNKTFYLFHLLLKDTEAVIGACGFHSWFPEHRRAEIGYHITLEANKNKGLMSEALAAILAFGFQELQLNRVEALIGRENTASQKLVQKFGFIQEGILREHYCKNGIIEDSVVFALLKRDFN